MSPDGWLAILRHQLERGEARRIRARLAQDSPHRWVGEKGPEGAAGTDPHQGTDERSPRAAAVSDTMEAASSTSPPGPPLAPLADSVGSDVGPFVGAPSAGSAISDGPASDVPEVPPSGPDWERGTHLTGSDPGMMSDADEVAGPVPSRRHPDTPTGERGR